MTKLLRTVLTPLTGTLYDVQSVEAARECGMACVVVAGRNPLYELTAADLVVKQLQELSFVNLKQLFGMEARVDPRVSWGCHSEIAVRGCCLRDMLSIRQMSQCETFGADSHNADRLTVQVQRCYVVTSACQAPLMQRSSMRAIAYLLFVHEMLM